MKLKEESKEEVKEEKKEEKVSKTFDIKDMNTLLEELCNYVRTYGFILTKVDNIPNINSFNIFKVKTFDKILEKAMEDRVNMIYVYDEHTCDFLFTSGGNLYIYTIKESEKYYSRVDKYFIQQQTVLK